MFIDNECDWTAEEKKKAIAWKDKDIVHALKPPYRRGDDEMIFLANNVPAGISIIDIHSNHRHGNINMLSSGKLKIEL